MEGSYTFDPVTGERREPKGYNATYMADEAIDFINDRDENPWMLMLSLNPPHPVYTDAPEELMERYRRAHLQSRPNAVEKLSGEQAGRRSRPIVDNLVGYNAHITAVDLELGRLVERLEETGQADNTIVVYTSDHGEMMGSHNYMGKRFPHEESCRVPFLVRYPGVVEAGVKRDTLLGAIDLSPTLCGLAGIAPPRHCQGRDLSPAFRGESIEEPEHAFMVHMNIKGVPQPIFRGIRTRRHTYAVGEEGRWVLFDNQEDPYQQRNLVSDSSRAGLMRELDGEILDYLKKAGDPYPYAEKI